MTAIATSWAAATGATGATNNLIQTWYKPDSVRHSENSSTPFRTAFQIASDFCLGMVGMVLWYPMWYPMTYDVLCLRKVLLEDSIVMNPLITIEMPVLPVLQIGRYREHGEGAWRWWSRCPFGNFVKWRDVKSMAGDSVSCRRVPQKDGPSMAKQSIGTACHMKILKVVKCCECCGVAAA